jgi:hypothetical protein
MSIFNVGKYLAERKKFNFRTYEIEGVEFDLIPLTDDLIQALKLNPTHSGSMNAAANFGISAGRNRAHDDAEMAEDLDAIWDLEQLDIDCEPSLQHKVGEKVCAISGLTEYMEDLKLEEEIKAEEAQNVIDGDKPIDSEITLGQLEEDALNNVAA